MTDLDVFLNDTLAGHLRSQDGDAPTFCYAPDYIRKSTVALSCSLPLREEPFSWPEARPFFAGLLPEGASRNIVSNRLGLWRRDDDLQLVKALCGDCPGAVSILPAGQTPCPEGNKVTWLSDEEFSCLLHNLSQRSLLAASDAVRLSLLRGQSTHGKNGPGNRRQPCGPAPPLLHHVPEPAKTCRRPGS